MRLRQLYAIVPVALLIAVACGLSACGRGGGPGQGGMPPQSVTVVTLKTGSVSLQRELPGLVSARLVAEVRPQVSGIVKRQLFTEGSMVAAGQVLYLLDDALYLAAERSAEAARMHAQAVLEDAKSNAERGSELVKAKMVSAQDNDNLPSAYQQAQADLRLGRGGRRRGPINVAYAHIARRSAGRIGKSTVTQGALVTANQADALADGAATRSDLCRRTQSSSEWLQLQQEVAGCVRSGERQPRQEIVLEDGSAYAVPGKLQFSRRDGRAEHRQLSAARAGAESGSAAAAGHVRARRDQRRGAATTRCWRRSRASPTIRRATPRRWWSGPTARWRCAMVKTARAVGDQWLVDAAGCRPATA